MTHWPRPSEKMVKKCCYVTCASILCIHTFDVFVGELVMNVLPRARVVQLNKMIGLQPTAAPTNHEACIALLSFPLCNGYSML